MRTPVLRRKLAAILEAEDVVPGSATTRSCSPRCSRRCRRTSCSRAERRRRCAHAPARSAPRRGPPRDPHAAARSTPHAHGQRAGRRAARHLLAAAARAGRRTTSGDRTTPTGSTSSVSLGDRNEALARFLLHARTRRPRRRPRSSSRTRSARLARSLGRRGARDLLADQDGLEEAGPRWSATSAPRLPRSYRDTVDPVARRRGPAPHRPGAHRRRGARDRLASRSGRDARRRAIGPTAGGCGSSPAEPRSSCRPSCPILESLGLIVVEEVPHRLLGSATSVHLHDFGVRVPRRRDRALGPPTVRAGPPTRVLAAWRGHAEVDPLNRLVLLADLDLARRRRPARLPPLPPPARHPVHAELRRGRRWSRTPTSTAALLDHFHARFDPRPSRAARRPARAPRRQRSRRSRPR